MFVRRGGDLGIVDRSIGQRKHQTHHPSTRAQSKMANVEAAHGANSCVQRTEPKKTAAANRHTRVLIAGQQREKVIRISVDAIQWSQRIILGEG